MHVQASGVVTEGGGGDDGEILDLPQSTTTEYLRIPQ